MRIPGSLPPAALAASRVGRAYGLPPKPPAPPAGPASEPTSRGLAGPADLRAVLNDEERAYFDQIAALGPITYGPGRKAGLTPEAPRGLRLDVQG
jgi:hypothetical protein